MLNRMMCSAKSRATPALLVPACDENNATRPPLRCRVWLFGLSQYLANSARKQLSDAYRSTPDMLERISCVFGTEPSARSLTYSCNTTLRREVFICRPPLYLIKPSFLNLFMKKLTRDRVVPTISASISCDTLGSNPWGWSSLP